MLKLLKYEIKESSKYFIYTIIGNIIASIILSIVIGTLEDFGDSPLSAIMLLAAFAVFVAAYVGFIFMMITSYRKDLYTDSAYLKFSLPLTGWNFLNAKTLLLIFWSFIMATVTIVVNAIVYSAMFPGFIGTFFKEFLGLNISIPSITVSLLLTIISFIEGIILLYFCITFVKSYFKKSKKGYIWFIVYIVFGIIWNIVEVIIAQVAPYYLSIGTELSIEKMDYFGFLEITSVSLSYNIVSIVLYLIICVGLYIFTAYMLDKKVDI
ncbi:hypothetical protein LJC13_02690 [Peptostreptococcaceae bacterium OttesenSCG-928-C18]|nr:hypothetical protein [Peptostreptococcaceae bacterium OttesenSCG-928-C18]